MPIFKFNMLTPEGKVDRGVVDLPFEDDPPAIRYLERQGGVVIGIKKLNPILTAVTRFATQGFGKVKRPELAEFFNNMGLLMGAGVPVLSAMEEIMQDMKNPMLVMTLKFMRTDIEGGQTFGEALARHPKVFSSLVQYMCRIGEETGSLDRMCIKCAEHLQHIEEIVSGTKRAMVYPGFIFFVVVGAVFVWFYFVVPKILKLFVDMGVEIPPITRIIMAFANWVQAYGIWSILGSVVAVMAFLTLRRKMLKVKYVSDYVALRIPVIKMIIETSLVARISEYLGILIGAGVGVVHSLEIITDSMTNLVYKGRLILVQDSVKNGNPLSDSLRSSEAMHPFAVRMVAVGELTGRIEEQTEYVAKLYRDKLNALVEVLGKVLEPAMLVFMGLVFGVIIIGVFLPIYDMLGNM